MLAKTVHRKIDGVGKNIEAGVTPRCVMHWMGFKLHLTSTGINFIYQLVIFAIHDTHHTVFIGGRRRIGGVTLLRPGLLYNAFQDWQDPSKKPVHGRICLKTVYFK